jgi:hypothetical protein
MRTTVLLVIVLLTLGLWSAPAMAGDHAVIQQLPASCQPVSDVELAQLSGKQGFSFNWCQVARCIYNQLPPPTQQKILCAVQVARTIYSCVNGQNTNMVQPLSR